MYDAEPKCKDNDKNFFKAIKILSGTDSEGAQQYRTS